MKITNRKPVDHTEYILEADKFKVQAEREKQYEKIYELEQKKVQYSAQQQDEDPEFRNCPSSSSFNIDDIQSISFGGLNSRFWMLRKHFNSASV